MASTWQDYASQFTDPNIQDSIGTWLRNLQSGGMGALNLQDINSELARAADPNFNGGFAPGYIEAMQYVSQNPNQFFGSTGNISGTNPASYYDPIMTATAAASRAGRSQPQQGMEVVPAETSPTVDYGTGSTGRGTTAPNVSRGTSGTTNRGGNFASGTIDWNVPGVTGSATQQGLPQWGTNYNMGSNTNNAFMMPNNGGFNWGAAGALYNQLNNLFSPATTDAVNQGQNLYNQLSGWLQQNFPTGLSTEMLQNLGLQGAMGNTMMQGGYNSLQPFQQAMNQNALNLAQNGAQAAPGGDQNAALINSLFGGQGGNYGLVDLMQQLYYQGLPGQTTVGNLVDSQNQFGLGQQQAGANLLQSLASGGTVMSPEQQQLLQTAMGLSQGGGLTPEYVQAMRSLVLDPSQEAMTGRINQMAGGGALLTSPAYQELMRRNEEQFNNQMIAQGFGNLQNFMSQAGNLASTGYGQGANLAGQMSNLGQSGIGNALSAFGAVPSAAFPYMQLAGNLGMNLGNQQLQGQSQYLNALNTANQLAYTPYLTGQQTANSTTDRQAQLLNQFLGATQGTAGQQMQYGLSGAGLLNNIAQQMMQGYTADQAIQNQLAIASAGQTGAALAGLTGAIPAIINAFTGGGGGGGGIGDVNSPTTPPFNPDAYWWQQMYGWNPYQITTPPFAT